MVFPRININNVLGNGKRFMAFQSPRSLAPRGLRGKTSISSWLGSNPSVYHRPESNNGRQALVCNSEADNLSIIISNQYCIFDTMCESFSNHSH